MSLAVRDFVLTSEKIRLNVWISIGAATVSCILCLFILGAAAWIYRKPWARHAIDRVSFRLLLWSMVFEVLYDVAYIAVDVESVIPGAPESACAAGVYFLMATLGTVNYLCTCIALNLMLIVCFNINPLEKRLERWYVGMSIILGMGLPIVPAALGHFGYDPVLEVCWIQAGDNATRMRYLVLDLYFWQALSCIVASLAVIATLVSLFRQRHPSSSTAQKLSKHPAFSVDTEQGAVYSQLENKFFKIACLISLYPIALIVVNGIITVGDLYLSAVDGVPNTRVYVLYCVYYFLYGGRGIVFAILGIFVDPCLRRGMRIAWRGNKFQAVREVQNPMHQASLLEILGAPSTRLDYETRHPSISVETLGEKYDGPRNGSKTSIELSAALSSLPMELRTAPASSPSRNMSARCLTKTFSGVHQGALPEGLTDEVDVRLGIAPRQRDPYLNWTEQLAMTEEEFLEPLDPDLPDAVEEMKRRRKAAQMDKEDAIRIFEETQTQL